MTVHQHTPQASPAERPVRRPGRLRRTALVAAGVLGCLLPTVWTLNFVRMLATGDLADHRFHQLTGQGLLLTALWLGGLVPMLLAAWQGRRPGTAPALLHLSFVGVGAACAVAAPQGGARALLVLIAVTGAAVWLALPRRARLRGPIKVAPAALTFSLLSSAAVAPYAVQQIGLQHGATGLHADNPHFFDMAWLVLTLALVGVLGALLPAARRLQVVAGGGIALTGVAMLALGEGAVRGALFAGVGVALALSWALASGTDADSIRRGADAR